MAKTKQLKFFSKEGQTFFKLNQELNKLSGDRNYHFSIRLILIIMIIYGVLLIIYFLRLPALIPFFYSQPWGQLQLADRKYFIYLFVFLFLTTITNLFIASKNRLEYPIITNIFVWATLMLWLMGIISMVGIFSILSVW